MLRKEQDWVAENPVLAAELDKFIGQRLRLHRDMVTYGEATYKSGTVFYIVGRWEIYLHGQPEGRTGIVALRPEWVDFKNPVVVERQLRTRVTGKMHV